MICKCGHKREKHDFTISEDNNIAQHCLGGKGRCVCKKYQNENKGVKDDNK